SCHRLPSKTQTRRTYADIRTGGPRRTRPEARGADETGPAEVPRSLWTASMAARLLACSADPAGRDSEGSLRFTCHRNVGWAGVRGALLTTSPESERAQRSPAPSSPNELRFETVAPKKPCPLTRPFASLIASSRPPQKSPNTYQPTSAGIERPR